MINLVTNNKLQLKNLPSSSPSPRPSQKIPFLAKSLQKMPERTLSGNLQFVKYPIIKQCLFHNALILETVSKSVIKDSLQ